MSKKRGHVLYSKWLKAYSKEFGTEYRGSRYRDASTMAQISEDVGEELFEEVMIDFLHMSSDPKIESLVFDFYSVKEMVEQKKKARLELKRLRDRTRERMKDLI